MSFLPSPVKSFCAVVASGGEGKEEEWIVQWIELLHSLRLLDIRSWLAVSKGSDASNLVYE